MAESYSHKKVTFLILFGMLLHALYTFLMFTQVPLNSDHACQVLQANDIISGNVLLKGWNLTGVSFYFSELPFYELGALLFGIDTKAYIFAAALMVVLLFCVAFPLCGVKSCRLTFSDFLLYTALAGMPTLTWLGYLRGHCAIFIYFFLALLCLKRLLEQPQPGSGWLVAYGLLLSFGCMSDMLLFIILVVPVLIFFLWDLLRNQRRYDPAISRNMICISLAALLIGLLLDRTLIYLGDINKNSFLDTRKFLDVLFINEKFVLLLEGMLRVFKADLSFISLFSLSSLRCIFSYLTLLCAGLIIFHTLQAFVRGNKCDAVNVILSLSLSLMTLICFMTDIYTNQDSPRYIAHFPFLCAVLILRTCKLQAWYSLRLAAGKLRLQTLITVLALVLILFSIQPLKHGRAVTSQDRLAIFLEENGLTSGYSDFWNSAHTTVASDNRVKVRAIRVHAEEIGKPADVWGQNWFCKDEWYQNNGANFIVFDGNAYLDVREDYLTQLLGEPQEILDNGEYRVYIYDRDLSDEIVLQ